MDHNVVTTKSVTLCTRCGKTREFQYSCEGTHDITDLAGTFICKKCGRSAGWPGIACDGHHEITIITGKVMCRKCGRSGPAQVFEKSRCNSNHSIVVVNGLPVCRRCGATKDWANLHCK